MRSRFCFLLLRVLRCFSSPGWLRRPMHSAGDEPDRFDPSDSGFPIRACRDQHLVGSSSGLIAASYALHRLPAPRHPPCALSNLTTLILASLASARPHGRAAPDARTLSRLAAGEWGHASDATAKHIAVDSYSPLCHSSLVKDPDRPADRRREGLPTFESLSACGRPLLVPLQISDCRLQIGLCTPLLCL